MDVRPYADSLRERWNAFIHASKNGTFLFRREYMEYHADRFCDESLLVLDGNDLVAVLPANRDGDRLVSHGGLTYGGFVTSAAMTTPKMLAVFADVRRFLLERGVRIVRYKRVPSIYHALPADEDAYALFRHGATLVRRDVLSVCVAGGDVRWEERRRRALKKAARAELTVRESTRFDAFWRILRDNLEARHGVRPVHDEAEIALLHERFPKNIRLFEATTTDGAVCGGVVIYETPRVAHAQYIAGSLEGRELGCLDALFEHLLKREYATKPYFDFGISTEQDGRMLNEGLVAQKEGFGARAVVHDHYEWKLDDGH